DTEARETWLENYSSFAEDFASKVRRKKNIILDYGRGTLRVAEEYVREEFKGAWRKFSQKTLSSFVEALAYVSRVIVLNFGGNPVFYRRTGKAVVENVAGLGIVALPSLWLNRVIHAEPPVMLEDYYDRVAWLVNRLKKSSFNIDENNLWNVTKDYGYKHHSLTGEKLRINKYYGGMIASFSFCPDCNESTHVTYLPLPYELFTELGELIKNIEVAVFKPTEWPCPKCKRQCLPLGYSYSTVVTKERINKSALKVFATLLSESEERILTLTVTSLGRGFVLSSLLQRDSKNHINKIEEPEESPLTELEAFFIFSSTPFCV
ncbi:MAG: hypothetical protein QXF52_09865, partial [Thermoproteota archaeon]